ncbi:MAG: HipA N-terminal domain-containing protein [Proteobacteria bacterium]|nr:HipA N-terminal domain-containing protein [Pseudomonadota bacterium]
MITKLNVWLTLPTGEILKAGELAIKVPDSGGALQGQFRYALQFLADPSAFSLDPLHLPMAAESFDADRPHSGVHGVFEDSLPDDWGRRLMARRYRLGRAGQRVPHLLQLLGSQGLRALTYAESEIPPALSAEPSSRHLSEIAILGVCRIIRIC